LEVLIVLMALGFSAALLIVPIFTFIAYARTNQLRTELEALKARLRQLEAGSRRTGPSPSHVPTPAPVPAAEPTAAAPPAPASTPARPGPSATPPPVRAVPPTTSPRHAPAPDLATNLGPKILVGFGALAVFASLAFFVKYAWDNDWVGPTGRVLFGLVVSLGLVAFGLRLLRREYRPLGQGLAGTGVAGLYVSVFGAHAFYGLISRELAGIFLVAITACAIALALRLGVRLLSVLAWLGAYLTPILLSTGKDQAVSLFAYLLVLGAAAVVIRRRRAWKETSALALVGSCVLYAGWAISFYNPQRFGVAALGLLALAALFTEILPASTLLLASGAIVVLAVDVDRPAALAGVLAAFAALAMLRRSRFEGAEAVTLLASGVVITVWLSQVFAAGREGDALLLAVSIGGAYFLALAIRGLLAREAVGVAGLATHLIGAGLLWSVLYRVFHQTNPSLLGLLAVALATVYLVLGLGLSRQDEPDAGHVRVTLGLAAAFLTLAIPVQLGLHGITLGWAVEGLVLLGLGVRFAAPLTRGVAYFVLALAVARLFARHAPLHDASFVPFLNAPFGTWLFVIGCLGAALIVARRPWQQKVALEQVARPALAALALLLLFGLLTAETQAAFAQQASNAAAAGLEGAAQRARLSGGLAISVLWSVFAIALLAGGLLARSRALFWTSYALFALAGLKVVFVDLAELHTLYRILSFLALGVLLMLGAYVNIRFSGRLAPRRGDQ
jgi:uncharacterized membrane protein